MANGFDPRSQFYKAQASQVAQKRQALTYARQRQDAEERTKIQNVNTLSGFNAAKVPEGPMREIYEDRIRDAQAYMNGAGSYEGQEYSALEAANKISGLTTMFNKMSAHNMGDVAEAQAAYKKGAFEVAEDRERINPYGDPSGEAVYANNSPDGYKARVQKHNNYFQWTGEYDANGDPLGYMMDEEGQPTGEPTSIFKMQGYANPSAFENDTVTEPIPALVDVVQDPKLQQRMNTIATRPSTLEEMKQQGITDPVKKHEFVVNRVLSDYMGTTKPDMEFRESIIRELQKNGSEFKPEEIDAFINNPSSNQELLSDIQTQAASVLADLTYTAPPVVSSPFEGKFEVQGRGGSVADAPYMVEVDRLRETVEVAGGENLPGTSNSYTINGVGFDQTNGDILIPITYTEAEEINDDLRGLGVEAGEITRNQTLRIPAGDLTQADPLALEAYRNLPPMEQARINSQIATSRVVSDEDMASELSGSTPTSQTPTPPPSPQPQQEETLDIEEIPLEEENLDEENLDEGVDGRPLTPLAALPEQDAELVAQATAAMNDPLMQSGDNYGPEVVAATETLRDPQAPDSARERARNVLTNAAAQRDQRAAGPERRERSAFESDAEGVDPQILEQYYNNVQPREYGLYPLPEGANIRGDQVVMDGQVVGSYESRMNPNTGEYVTGMRPMAVEPQSEAARQAGEAVSNIASSASDLAADIRDNAGGNLRRAYDAAIETLGSAGSSLMDFIRGGGPTQQEVDRQRFEAARQRQAAEEALPPVSEPDPSTVVDFPEGTPRGQGEPIPTRGQAGSPRQAEAERSLRERLESEEDRLIEEQGVTMATPIEKGGVAFKTTSSRSGAGKEDRSKAFSNAVNLFKSAGAKFPVVAASQFVLESNQGASNLSQETNNGFGIKYTEAMDKKFKEMGIEAKKSDKTYYDDTEAKTGAANPNAYYFSFPSVEEGFKGYLAFIEANPRYKKALAAGSEMDYLRGITKAGYATGNDGKGGGYIESISKIAKGYGFNIEDVAPEEPTTK